MDDRYAELRAALNLDLPPLPWHAPGLAELHDADDVCVACFSDCEPVEQERRPVPSIEAGDRFARYVVAADKETIRALLADFDEASARAFYETSVAQAAIEQVKVLEAERDRLRDALDAAQKSLNTIATLGGSKEDFMGTMRQVRGYANSRARVARAALAQKQGESDGM